MIDPSGIKPKNDKLIVKEVKPGVYTIENAYEGVHEDFTTSNFDVVESSTVEEQSDSKERLVKVLLSKDVLLEAILNRTPLVESAQVWFKSELINRSVSKGVVETYLLKTSVDVILFILSSKNEQKAKEFVSYFISEYNVCQTTYDDIENKIPLELLYQEKNSISEILRSYEKEYAKKNGYYYVTLEPLLPLLSVNNDISKVITPQMLADSLVIVEASYEDMSNNAAPQALRGVVEKTRLITQRREALRQILDDKLKDQPQTIVQLSLEPPPVSLPLDVDVSRVLQRLQLLKQLK
ncbi:hypothetical protein SAMD00079811_64380 [Scytonema sp. HK-05]|uniref:hypothetical protein n=1 Tax=Scytonema sp. HK-05 TaxID=1137095 RepID=UPI00093690BE|nr:hypothetical protein [Scytonema sp. HK-05]OKH59022.1 hypothetical protein NIES2130_10690 [Scytonema sp. HK-05]BAY48812.1 hypothetical protein SAMD00079811_64380 [Scytonema sp. HK-05]